MKILSDTPKNVVISFVNFGALFTFIILAFYVCYFPIGGKFYTNQEDIWLWLERGLSFFGLISLSSFVPTLMGESKIADFLKDRSPKIFLNNKIFLSFLSFLILSYTFIILSIVFSLFERPNDVTANMLQLIDSIQLFKYLLIALNAYYCSILGIRDILELQ